MLSSITNYVAMQIRTTEIPDYRPCTIHYRVTNSDVTQYLFKGQ